MKAADGLADTAPGGTSPRETAMNTPVNDCSKTDPKPPEAEALAGSQKSDLDATVRRLKGVFSEGRKTEARENPEAGCVPWYHFTEAPKDP